MDMETEILSLVIDKGDVATTTAVVQVKIALDLEDTVEVVQRTCKVHVRTKLDAPHFRIKRRVHAQARSATLAYFDGQDLEEKNIFADIEDEFKLAA